MMAFTFGTTLARKVALAKTAILERWRPVNLLFGGHGSSLLWV
jgi:hypothetical protein